MNANYTMKITPLNEVSLWDCKKANIEFVFTADTGKIKTFKGTIKR